MAGDLRRGQRLLPLRPRKRQPAPAARRKSCRWPPSAPAASPGSTCSSSTAARRRGRAGSRRAPRCRCSRASWSRFKEPALPDAPRSRRSASSRRAPSSGVQVKTPAGSMYAEYTYAPSDRILNGFIQAVVGLYDYTQITKDPLGLKLFEAGDAEARAETPHYDTGAWSMYDQYSESNLNYHELLTEFLAAPVRTHAQRPADEHRPADARRRRRPTTTNDTADHHHADDAVGRHRTDRPADARARARDTPRRAPRQRRRRRRRSPAIRSTARPRRNSRRTRRRRR